ncbi:MAG: aldolase/citrate lyase family protein [Oscillatoria sp. PMC 1068.18]|nr:aldolase/citrate lyase family protein [Oscillatoria sp. PMC 1076.18]MEC4989845.1 aldolase/citrate lyase family protein [Oscillatoria sp. PMC 1068.18]
MTDLTAMLKLMNSQYGLCSLKAGTEWEDMNYSEIEYLYALGQKELPILVKIAGPEAKTDLRHLRAIGVNGLLCPMVESEYALEKFVITAQKAYAESNIEPTLAINIKTIAGYQKLNEILNNPYFKAIDTVVIGRLDLSLSMQINNVDNPEVVQITQNLANQVRRLGKHVSVGGFVNPSSAVSLQEFNIDRLSTIHTMFDLNRVTDVTASVWKGIEFEIAFYQSLIEINPSRKEFYQSRIATSQAKLDKASSLLQTSEQFAKV